MNHTTISEIIQYLNSSGGIPLTVTQTTQTNWLQFGVTAFLAAVGSIFIFIILGQMFGELIFDRIAKLQLYLIKRKTNRHQLIIKHSGGGMFSPSMINEETLKKIQRAFLKFQGKDFDLILHTPGGAIFQTSIISRMLKNYSGRVRVFIPSYSMSGGTMLALSGDEIYMSPNACLGPVDPQLGNLFKFGSAKSWDYIKKFKGKKAEDSSISMALTGKQYTKSISNYLGEILDGTLEEKQINKFVKFLTSGNVEHAYQLTPEILSDFGLKVNFINDDLQERLMKIVSSNACEGVHYV